MRLAHCIKSGSSNHGTRNVSIDAKITITLYFMTPGCDNFTLGFTAGLLRRYYCDCVEVSSYKLNIAIHLCDGHHEEKKTPRKNDMKGPVIETFQKPR